MMLYSGVYGNPNNVKAKNKNLGLLYNCAPMSCLVELAREKPTDGVQRILDIEPKQVHLFLSLR
ncbi:putative fructose-bisphosphatase [Helianthus annuus]|nr:putative fructose-bisphosphatase [Helianthus annuus]